MPKKTYLKDPVTIQLRKLANGRKSIYLDIHQHGERRYEFLCLYLWPARSGDHAMRQHNKLVLQQAMAIKAKRTQECLLHDGPLLVRPSHDLLLTEWQHPQHTDLCRHRHGQEGGRGQLV